MKTKILNILMLLAVAVGFAACNDDTEPVLAQLTDLQITEQDAHDVVLQKSDNGNVAFTVKWNAPTFNLNVAKSYRIEVAESEAFENAVSVATTTATEYSVKVSELNTAVRKFYTDIKDCTPKDIYVRVRCELNSDASFIIASATHFSLNVTPYEGEYPRLYIIGSVQEPYQGGGWNIEKSNYVVIDSTGTNVYKGYLGIREKTNDGGQEMFRFYASLEGADPWNNGYSYGSQEADAGMEFDLTNEVYEGPMVNGKGSWILPVGTYFLTVDMANLTVKFERISTEWRETAISDEELGGSDDEGGEVVEPATGLFLVGDYNGWNTTGDGSAGAFTETSEGSNIWNGTFALPEAGAGSGKSYFRFYTEFPSGTVGTVSGSDEELTLVDGYAETSVEPGNEGAFVVASGTYSITVNLNDNSMLIEQTE